MKKKLTLFKNGLCLLFMVQLLGSCASEEKHIPGVHHVQIKSMKFEPARLTVNKGDTIVWTNLDIVTHDVTEEKTTAWASPPLLMGKTWKMAARENADYFCSIHLVMKGKIIVKD